ncbi:hypothetical protein ABIB34_000853 [Rhodococcus sp. UYP5]
MADLGYLAVTAVGFGVCALILRLLANTATSKVKTK